MGKEVFVHLQLVGVFVVIGSLVTDLLLTLVALDTTLEGSLFIVKRLEHGCESVLPLEVVLVNQPHQLLQSVLGLESLLLGLPVFIGLLLINLLLVLEAVLGLIELDLNGNEVGFHASDHMVVRALHQNLLIVLVLYPVEVVLR